MNSVSLSLHAMWVRALILSRILVGRRSIADLINPKQFLEGRMIVARRQLEWFIGNDPVVERLRNTEAHTPAGRKHELELFSVNGWTYVVIPSERRIVRRRVGVAVTRIQRSSISDAFYDLHENGGCRDPLLYVRAALYIARYSDSQLYRHGYPMPSSD